MPIWKNQINVLDVQAILLVHKKHTEGAEDMIYGYEALKTARLLLKKLQRNTTAKYTSPKFFCPMADYCEEKNPKICAAHLKIWREDGEFKD